MDLLPQASEAPADGSAVAGRGLRRGVVFRPFKLVNMAMEETLRAAEITYGRLANSLTYYVRSNSKARMRAALSLAFKVGSTTGSFGVEGLTWKMLRSQETEAGLRSTYKLILLSGCCFNAGIFLMLYQRK